MNTLEKMKIDLDIIDVLLSEDEKSCKERRFSDNGYFQY